MSSHSERGEGRRGDGGRVREGAAVWSCAAGVERQRERTECFQRWGEALQVKSICSWPLAWTNEAETCDKGEHAEKANGRQRAVVFALDTVFPHAASFTVFPSLNAFGAEARGAFSLY